MATVIRMARGGAKKRPFYRIVAADKRAPRDGKFLEKLGTYNPNLPKDDENRIQLNAERVKHWIGTGAKPSETVARFIRQQGIADVKPTYTPRPKGYGRKKEVEEPAPAAESAAEPAPAKEAAAE